MNFLRSPKNKLILAGVLVLALALLAPATTQSAPSLARWSLAAVSVAALCWWLSRSRRTKAAFPEGSKLEVLARTGLSPKCAVALIEADGRKYLIVHGEGFAKIRESRPQTLAAPAPRVVRSASPHSFRKLGLP